MSIVRCILRAIIIVLCHVLPAVTVVVEYCTCGLKVLIAVHVTAVYFRICHDL